MSWDWCTRSAAASTSAPASNGWVFSKSSRADAVSADRAAVEEVFSVVKTGKNPHHYTVELPKPVTQEVADQFNGLFGR
jgi:hypothetical protein